MLVHSIHAGFNHYSYSQTGCKLMFFTEYGMRHVIATVVCCMLFYAYYGLHYGFDSVNAKLSTWGVGWLLLLLASIEGLFGMVPAM